MKFSIFPFFFVLMWSGGSSKPTFCRDSSNQIITTCTKCLWQPECVWCPEHPSGDNLALGCIKKGSYRCKQPEIVSKGDENKTVVITSKPLGQKPSVQITPQLIDLEVNPAKATNINFDASLSENPVDIYFIMDLSNSMLQYQTNLVNTASAIANKIKELTPDYKLGFGSFSDKPTAPFASEISYYEKNNKPVPYAFRHQLSLTNDSNLFKEKVRNSGLAANVDSPEAGLDALVQSITCDTVIGWRSDVRRVIIFITDEEPHYALDGVLGGIVMPNSGSCSTRQVGVNMDYSEQLTRDYPSFSQVRELMNDNQMPVVIFAIKDRMEEIYSELSLFLQGTKNVGTLTNDATSLQEIVTQQYRDIKSRLVVNSDFDSSKINVELKSNCNDSESQSNKEICRGVKENQTISYEAKITIKERECVKHQIASETKEFLAKIDFELAGFPKDTLQVRVKCEKCSCTSENIPNAVECSGRGDLVCGGCECRTGFSGQRCECDLSRFGGFITDTCHPANSSGVICSDRGECVCGHCQCDPLHLGDFCECRYDSCPMVDKKICSGQGSCQCHGGANRETSCSCDEGYTGTKCECPISDKMCRDVHTKEVCSNHGECYCGACKCHGGYEGKYCQRSLKDNTCKKLFPCVQVHQFKSNISQSQMNEWESECKQTTKEIFGEYINVACQRIFSIENQRDDAQTELFYKDGSDQNCKDVIAELNEMEKKAKEAGDQVESTGEQDKGPQRGDISGDLQESVRRMSADDKRLERCVLVHERCEVIFYHEGLESDAYFEEKKLGRVFVVHHNGTEDGSWSPLVHCTEIPLEIVLGSTMGILFLACLAAFIAILVLINIRDRHAWLRYIAMREENEGRLGQFQNPLYQEQPQSTFKNPAFNN